MIHETRYTDRQLLLALVIEALEKAHQRLHRPPTRREVFDELFPGGAHDPEALELARKLSHVIDELLDEWFTRFD